MLKSANDIYLNRCVICVIYAWGNDIWKSLSIIRRWHSEWARVELIERQPNTLGWATKWHFQKLHRTVKYYGINAKECSVNTMLPTVNAICFYFNKFSPQWLWNISFIFVKWTMWGFFRKRFPSAHENCRSKMCAIIMLNNVFNQGEQHTLEALCL